MIESKQRETKLSVVQWIMWMTYLVKTPLQAFQSMLAEDEVPFVDLGLKDLQRTNNGFSPCCLH
jgi:hypothetical protein